MCAGRFEPFSEIRCGGMPARIAIASSWWPNTSQPTPVSARSRHTASTFWPFSAGRSWNGPSRHADDQAAMWRATFARSVPAETT